MEIDWHSVAAWYFAIINVVAVIIYGWDKLCAIRKWWRVPELTLLMQRFIIRLYDRFYLNDTS